MEELKRELKKKSHIRKVEWIPSETDTGEPGFLQVRLKTRLTREKIRAAADKLKLELGDEVADPRKNNR